MNQTIDFLSPANSMFLLALFVAVTMAYLAVRLSSGRSSKLSRKWPIYLLRGLFLATLLALLLNPVRVTEREGAMEPSQVFFLLDASESMAIGNENETRWDDAIRKIDSATKAASETAAVEVSLFQFGRRLKAVESPASLGLVDSFSKDGMGVTFVEKESDATASIDGQEQLAHANEPDTQLVSALQQISSRFGRKPPAAVVVFSDGRARDASRAELVSETFSKLGVPIHAAPVGDTTGHGDIALVSLVVPSSTRKQSEVNAQVFLRSYGFDDQRVQVQLNSIDENKQKLKRLASVPVTLKSGFQSVPINFRTDSTTQLLEAVVSQQPNEVSTDNNRFESELTISREKIRVLYYEGSRMPSIPTVSANGAVTFKGPTSPLEKALKSDPDIECVSIQVSVDMLRSFPNDTGTFPGSAADLSGFDAVILSDIPRRTFTGKQLEWIERWVRQRGGGLCMLGGRNSFGSGEWNNSQLEKILPVKFKPQFDWQNAFQVEVNLDIESTIHPTLKIASDDQLNRDLLGKFPGFTGANVGLLPKPDMAKVLAVASAEGNVAPGQRPSSLFTSQGIREVFSSTKRDPAVEIPNEFAAVTVGQYGKGRSMAMSLPITGPAAERFLKWGTKTNENRYYAQFWRNTIYWLTERSSVGRRRLVAKCDKRHYGPGETITLDANAFMETSKRTTSYRIVGMIEPQSFDQIDSDYSVVRWPNNVPRPDASESAFVIWGEEFELPVKKIAGTDQYQIELPIAETLPSGSANQSMRIELTAYEGGSQVDSTSVPIQILHDPFEQQNPFPNHELLTTLAEGADGSILESDEDLAKLMKELPISRGPSEFSSAPIWSQWWAMTILLGLATSEWCYRRWIGLA
jgi:uncharacterized membrane protein